MRMGYRLASFRTMVAKKSDCEERGPNQWRIAACSSESSSGISRASFGGSARSPLWAAGHRRLPRAAPATPGCGKGPGASLRLGTRKRSAYFAGPSISKEHRHEGLFATPWRGLCDRGGELARPPPCPPDNVKSRRRCAVRGAAYLTNGRHSSPWEDKKIDSSARGRRGIVRPPVLKGTGLSHGAKIGTHVPGAIPPTCTITRPGRSGKACTCTMRSPRLAGGIGALGAGGHGSGRHPKRAEDPDGPRRVKQDAPGRGTSERCSGRGCSPPPAGLGCRRGTRPRFGRDFIKNLRRESGSRLCERW